MTIAELEAMTDRELDALVATTLGIEVFIDSDKSVWHPGGMATFRPSTDADPAWFVVEKMRAAFYTYSIGTADTGHHCCFKLKGTDGYTECSIASMPRAVSIAAILAVQASKGGSK